MSHAGTRNSVAADEFALSALLGDFEFTAWGIS